MPRLGDTSTSDRSDSVAINVLSKDCRFEAVNMKHPRIAVRTAPLWLEAIRPERENRMSEPVAKALEEHAFCEKVLLAR